MGKISPKSSYKNMVKATKSTQFFVNKQAAKQQKKQITVKGAE